MNKRMIYIILFFGLFITNYVFCETQKYEELLRYKGSWQFGSAVLDNTDESLIVMESEWSNKTWYKNVYWLRNGKKDKVITNARNASISIDGRYFSYENDKELNIFDNGKIKNILRYDGRYILYALPVESSSLYYYEKSKKYKIVRFDIESGIKEDIITSDKYEYFNPKTVSNTNILYLLKNHNFKEGPEKSTVVKYYIKSKKFEDLRIPIKKYEIKDSYTVSPNNKFLILANSIDFCLYVINLEKNKVIDIIKIPESFTPPESYSWRNDCSYVIFSFGNKRIVKYTLPKKYWDTNTENGTK